MYQEEGGFLLSERCIINHVIAAQRRGAEVHTREQVLDWSATSQGVSVRTEHSSYEANSLVITAGAWASQLVPGLEAQAERQVLGWFEPHKPELFSPERFPVFNLLVDEGRYYGFPVYGVPGFKLGRYHHLDEQVNPDKVDQEVYEHDEAVLRNCAANYFPEANGPARMFKTCMFTNSPDEHFIIGTHPDYAQVSFAAGFSGHGFKFCSVVGEIMSDLALAGTTSLPTQRFAPERYGSVNAL